MAAEERENGPVLNWEDMQEEWVRCPVCTARVKSDNIEGHLEKVHDEKLEIKGKPKEKSFPYIFLVVAVVVILAIASAGYVFFMNTSDDANDTNTTPDDNQDTGGEWWESYQPRYDVGSGEDDWWIDYPEINPETGSSVEHPQWVLDSLQEKPVVIFTHSEGCAPCVEQQEDIGPIMDEYGAEVRYYDLMADGSDLKAFDVFDSYDSNGGQSYIPLTAVVTLEEHNGDVEVVWHSTEGATGEDWIRDYMKDAIYYHQMNLEAWGGT
ncbi:MAG: hypothetical protein ACQESD_06385 [Thermoplasmatota archaeon]